MQGDVIAILNDSGTCVAEYSYDAWGNCTITKDTNTIALDNPIRYRGYYYDVHLGLYYLQSRFYDANTGRFINADEIYTWSNYQEYVSEMLVTNMFTYCNNEPVQNEDPYGNYKTENIKYDRKKACAYAAKWAYDFNHQYKKINSDCTNFVSQCLYAGGVKMTKYWYCKRRKVLVSILSLCFIVYNWTYPWSFAQGNHDYFEGNGFTKECHSCYSFTNVEQFIKDYGVKKGDLLYFVSDIYNSKHIFHAAIVTSVYKGSIKYASHTDAYRFRPVYMFFRENKNGMIHVLRMKDTIKWNYGANTNHYSETNKDPYKNFYY